MLQFKFSSRTCQEYNQYITAMVGCLWTSNVFQKDFHPQGIHLEADVLEKMKVKEYRKGLNIVYHPALTGYATLFLQQVRSWCFAVALSSILPEASSFSSLQITQY